MNNKTEEKEKNNKKWLLLLLLLLFICLSGYIIYQIGYSYGEKKRAVAIDPTPQITVIEIKDNYGVWTDSGVVNETNIFSEIVDTKKRVAPYDTGMYEFEVVNKSKGGVSYRLYFEEENRDKINIKYKLKKNGEYVIGGANWVYYNEVELKEQLLESSSSDKFELEWSWVSENDELDTKIGTQKERATYKLTINVIAGQKVQEG